MAEKIQLGLYPLYKKFGKWTEAQDVISEAAKAFLDSSIIESLELLEELFELQFLKMMQEANFHERP